MEAVVIAVIYLNNYIDNQVEKGGIEIEPKEYESYEEQMIRIQKEKNKASEELNKAKKELHIASLKEKQLKTILLLKNLTDDIAKMSPEEFEKVTLPLTLIDLKMATNNEKTLKMEQIKELKEEKNPFLLPKEREYLLEVIGKTGISRSKELQSFLEKDEKGKALYDKGNGFEYVVMSDDIRELRLGGFLEASKLNLGSKGGYNYLVFELTEKAKKYFYEITQKQPVISEKDKTKRIYGKLEHGYLIKDCAYEFSNMDYLVSLDRDNLNMDILNFEKKQFDLIIEKDGEECYIEVNRGNLSEEDFFRELDKTYYFHKSNEKQKQMQFYFVEANDTNLFGKTKKLFLAWYQERVQNNTILKGEITVHFTTFSKIKQHSKKLWESIEL